MICRKQKRYRKDRLFKAYSLLMISICFAVLFAFLYSIISSAIPSLFKTTVGVSLPSPDARSKYSFYKDVRELNFSQLPYNDYKFILNPNVKYFAQDLFEGDGLDYNKTYFVNTKGSFDLIYKSGEYQNLHDLPLQTAFNTDFFTQADSVYPESSGIFAALKGTLYILLISLGIVVPVSIFTAIFLCFYLPQNFFGNLFRVNLSNLAAVPSIIYGLIGLYIFLQVGGLPRSSPLVGGLTLSLLALPFMITTCEIAIKNVPSVYYTAYTGMGATKLRAILGVIRIAVPGIITGMIITMSRILGETAPLIAVGMVAFISSVPTSVTDSATALPVQIYLWSSMAQESFHSKASLAILVLILTILILKIIATFLRHFLDPFHIKT